MDKLKPAVDKKVLEAVNTLLELTSVQTSEYGEICFELGFKHGMRLMAEATDAPQNTDILELFYYGEITPAGEFARSDEYWCGSKEYNRLQDEFTASLNDEQRDKYMTLCDALHTWQSVSDKELYCEGLKYGAKISSALK